MPIKSEVIPNQISIANKNIIQTINIVYNNKRTIVVNLLGKYFIRKSDYV